MPEKSPLATATSFMPHTNQNNLQQHIVYEIALAIETLMMH
jgi:hypothetical protein